MVVPIFFLCLRSALLSLFLRSSQIYVATTELASLLSSKASSMAERKFGAEDFDEMDKRLKDIEDKTTAFKEMQAKVKKEMESVGVQTSQMQMMPTSIQMFLWESFDEDPSSMDDSSTITASGLLEQINVTRDTSDYLWYTTRKGFRYEHDTIVDEAAILLNQDFVFGTTPIKDLDFDEMDKRLKDIEDKTTAFKEMQAKVKKEMESVQESNSVINGGGESSNNNDQVGVQTSQMQMMPTSIQMFLWESFDEDPSSMDDSSTITASGLLEQINVTRDTKAAILLNQDFVFGTTPIKDLVRQMEYTLWYFGLNMLGQSPLCFLNI
ncbi:hypothetical protein Ahy_A03g015431 isoform D [Arachis hypogaea]|uniref:Uncharacterized protein n=1 Tax=Arachis hypogaea TaxID=3818 RepID=A0A445E0I7_ARAHY|nr:hypothetical protein Ahy_A03g015431 isoform D [Arachis hypogaea]